MNANLTVKHDTYYAIISYTESGNRKQKWIPLDLPVKSNNRRQAREAMLKAFEEFQARYEMPGVPIGATLVTAPNADILFTDYVEQWLIRKKPHVELSTWEGYNIYATKHIIPYFKPLALKPCDVKPMHIKQYYLDKSRFGRMDGKSGGLSLPSLKKHALVIKSVLDDAALDELVSKNSAVGVKIPAKPAVADSKRTFLSADEANLVLKAFVGHPLEPMVYLTLYYGLRRSEALGLKWGAIDFQNKTMVIKHTVVKNVTVVAKDKTKTDTSRHVFMLTDDAIKMLNVVKEKQIKMQMYYGDQYKQSDYIFTWEDGKLFLPDYITKSFQKVLAAHKIPAMRFHDLRHSTASILHDIGWDIKDIQEWLRHASVETTADIYTHISEARKKKLTDNLGDFIKPAQT